MPLIALDMIVRNASRSLVRAIESVRPHVDEIVIGIDSRTEDMETYKVATKYADTVLTFGHEDIGLTGDSGNAPIKQSVPARGCTIKWK